MEILPAAASTVIMMAAFTNCNNDPNDKEHKNDKKKERTSESDRGKGTSAQEN